MADGQPDQERRVSVSATQPTALEINTTNTVINSHSGDTFVGSNVNISNQESPAINFNEDIQIRIQSTAPITVESPQRVPNVIINNFGPTVNVTNEMLQDEQQMEQFFQRLYNLSFQVRQLQQQETDPLEVNGDGETFVRLKSVRKTDVISRERRQHAFTISINGADYSLKKTSRRHQCWNNIVPSEYLTVSRMVYSALMVFITVAMIYLILILSSPDKLQ